MFEIWKQPRVPVNHSFVVQNYQRVQCLEFTDWESCPKQIPLKVINDNNCFCQDCPSDEWALMCSKVLRLQNQGGVHRMKSFQGGGFSSCCWSTLNKRQDEVGGGGQLQLDRTCLWVHEAPLSCLDFTPSSSGVAGVAVLLCCSLTIHLTKAFVTRTRTEVDLYGCCRFLGCRGPWRVVECSGRILTYKNPDLFS